MKFLKQVEWDFRNFFDLLKDSENRLHAAIHFFHFAELPIESVEFPIDFLILLATLSVDEGRLWQMLC